MKKKLKFLVSSALVAVSFLGVQTHSSHAMEKEVVNLKSYTAEKLGLKMGEGVFNEALNFEKEFTSALINYQENQKEALGLSKGKDIVAAIGNTGSGKSTLLNLLTNQKIKATNSGYILDDENSSDSFPIGTGSESKTLLPKVVLNNDLIFVDLPGFSDTRGKGASIVSAIFIRDILINANSVRFLFVEGEDTITGQRGKGFKKTLIVTKELLQNPNDLIGSSLLTITKSHSVFQKELLKFLKEKLRPETFKSMIGMVINNYLEATTDIGDKKEKESALSILDKVFSLGDLGLTENPSHIWPFAHCAGFKKMDFRKQEEIIDVSQAQEAAKYTKETIEEDLKSLNKIKVSDINFFALLESSMDTKITRLFNIIHARHFLPLFENEYRLSTLSYQELENLQLSIETQKDALKKEFIVKPEISLIQNFNTFDESLKDQFDVNKIFESVDGRVKALEININNEIENRSDLNGKKKNDEEIQKRKYYRENNKYKDKCKRIDNLFLEFEEKKKDWENYDASFSGWDIFTLGISYGVKQSRKSAKAKAYYNKKSELIKEMHEYHTHPLIMEKHPRHDEVVPINFLSNIVFRSLELNNNK